MTSRVDGVEGGSGQKWLKFRRKWMITGERGEGGSVEIGCPVL